MKIKLSLAILVVTLLGTSSASALVCQWCDDTMPCSQSYLASNTWLASTCGGWGGCAKYPACDSPCSIPGQTGTCTFEGVPTSCSCSVEQPQVWICRQ